MVIFHQDSSVLINMTLRAGAPKINYIAQCRVCNYIYGWEVLSVTLLIISSLR